MLLGLLLVVGAAYIDTQKEAILLAAAGKQGATLGCAYHKYLCSLDRGSARWVQGPSTKPSRVRSA